MIYIVYWINDYKRALDSLHDKAVAAQVRYVMLNKAYLLPDVLKRFDLGLQGNLLAVCSSSVVYNQETWRRTFGEDQMIEIASLDSDSEAEFNKWFDAHITPFSKRRRGGVVRTIVRSADEDERAQKRRRDEEIKEDFMQDMQESFRQSANCIADNVLQFLGTRIGHFLADKQDEFLVANKRDFAQWAKFKYYFQRNQLSEHGRHIMYAIEGKVDEFFSEYRGIYNRNVSNWKNAVRDLLRDRIKEYAIDHDIPASFLEPSWDRNIEHWLEVEYPKIYPKYYLGADREMFKKSILSRVMPYEEHLKNLAKYSPAPPPSKRYKVVGVHKLFDDK